MAPDPEVYERVRFEATFEDVVDVTERYLKASPAARRVRRNDIGATVASTAVACFIVSVLVSDLAVWAGVAVAIPVGLLALGVYPLIHDRIVARRTRRLLREGMRGADSIPVDIQLTSIGVVLRASNDTTTVEWQRVVRISDLPEGIEILAEAAVVVIRARAFATSEERATFLARARSLASIPSNPQADPSSTPAARE